jgi:hypothetical protein
MSDDRNPNTMTESQNINHAKNNEILDEKYEIITI